MVETIQFNTDGMIVKLVVEAERLRYGHLHNPTFATEISQIDPLPHQRIAVYDYMLKQSPLRFLLADDAGAGKTIMAGLYLREMLSRRLIQRVLVVPPAGLVTNWQREMQTLFNLHFSIVRGGKSQTFTGVESDFVIVSVDTLASEKIFSQLKQAEPYDLVIFDEAHKLAANRDADFTIRRTDRYRLAEALCGVSPDEIDPIWRLGWACPHVLLLTATPHMGKDYPYYALWRLLLPEELAAFDAFAQYPTQQRQRHFLRRIKEEMVYPDGNPLYPERKSDTLTYALSREVENGGMSELALYEATTEYLRNFYNKAPSLNRSAARLAMGVFQRRLTSSTYALLRSFERRHEKLTAYLQEIRDGRTRPRFFQHSFLDESSADEYEDGDIQHNEDELLATLVEVDETQVMLELDELEKLISYARTLDKAGTESKFSKLREVILDPTYKNEKILIFTEHRDTLAFLVERLEALGYSGKIAQIHGGFDSRERDEQLATFRDPNGATYLIATDAAGEGLNMQFCRIMLNYDIPWNPARLEQRMGRIHRYGQRKSVVILNLVASNTREGRVLKTLLDKIQTIRNELGDKVFDIIGQVLENVSIKQYIERALTEDDTPLHEEIERRINAQSFERISRDNERAYHPRGDVASHLSNYQQSTERDLYRRLMPGYVQHWVNQSNPYLGLRLYPLGDNTYHIIPQNKHTKLWWDNVMRPHDPAQLQFSFQRGQLQRSPGSVFLHPGEPFFEALVNEFHTRHGASARIGGVLTDANTLEPYTLYAFRLRILRSADVTVRQFQRDEVLEDRLLVLRRWQNGTFEELSPEHWLILQPCDWQPSWIRYSAYADEWQTAAMTHAQQAFGERWLIERQTRLGQTQTERATFIQNSYLALEIELGNQRQHLTKKVQEGDRDAQASLARVRHQQGEIRKRRDRALFVIEREPQLMRLDEIELVAQALVLPSQNDVEAQRQLQATEAIAMQFARAYEEGQGATVYDVSTRAGAQARGFPEYPGFDLYAVYPNGEKRHIEVKGRAHVGDVELTRNEWQAAANWREDYYLYTVFDCNSAYPRLLRICNPFHALIEKQGGARFAYQTIVNAAQTEYNT